MPTRCNHCGRPWPEAARVPRLPEPRYQAHPPAVLEVGPLDWPPGVRALQGALVVLEAMYRAELAGAA